MTPSANDYLVNYGRNAFLGRFRAPADLQLDRGDRVVVRSPRGVEIGAVLCPADGPRSRLSEPEASGELIRRARREDEEAAESHSLRAEALLADAQNRAERLGLPLTLLDAELFLNGSAVLQAVHWGECNAGPLLEALGERHGLIVRLQDDTRKTPAATEAHGCGKPGCGSESGGCSSCGSGGGCSTGGCSRGSVKSADELTAYFAGLRAQMEAQHQRVPLG